jgi:hypothetical protein
MRSLLIVAAREIRERRALAALPLLLAAIPLVGPPLGLWTAQDRSDLAAALFVALAIVTTLVAGASVVGRDLGQRRLGFYFSRPLPWWSIWGGKMLSGLLLALLSAVVLVAAMALDKNLMSHGRAGHALMFVTWVLLGLGLAHYASLVYRSRSTWAALDFGLLVLAGIWLFRLVLLYYTLRSRGTGLSIGDLWQGGLALVFLLAGAVGFAGGRTSERRGRTFASAVVWSLLIPSLLGCEWHIRAMMFRVSPADVATVFSVAPGPDGAWLRVEAARDGRGLSQALYHSGRAQLTPTAWAWHSGHEKYLAFSADGRWAAWVGRELDSRRGWSAQLNRLDLQHPGARPEQLSIPVGWDTDVLALSRDGTRMLTRHGEAFSIQETPSGRQLASQPLGPGRLVGAFFEDQQAARAYVRDDATKSGDPSIFRIRSLHAESGAAETTGRIQLPPGKWLFTWSPDARSLMAQDFADVRDPGCYVAFDARTGERQFGVGECNARPDTGLRRGVGARFLADGRLVVIRRDPNGARLDVVSARGEAKPVMPLGDARVLDLGGEVAPGCLVVGLSAESQPSSPGEWRVVDINAAKVVGRGHGRLWVERAWIDPTTAPPSGSLGASCFVVDGRLLRWDASAREARQLLPYPAR